MYGLTMMMVARLVARALLCASSLAALRNSYAQASIALDHTRPSWETILKALSMVEVS